MLKRDKNATNRPKMHDPGMSKKCQKVLQHTS